MKRLLSIVVMVAMTGCYTARVATKMGAAGTTHNEAGASLLWAAR